MTYELILLVRIILRLPHSHLQKSFLWQANILCRLRGHFISQGNVILAILAACVTIEVFVYTLVQLVDLFHAFPAILDTACYFIHIFWVVNGMYIIYLFPDGQTTLAGGGTQESVLEV